MFFGEYKHIIDEKSRLRVPAKLKPGLNNEYVVTKGTNSCLFIFSKSYFQEQFLNKLNAVPTFNIESQKPIRMLLSSTYEVEEDGQGRFLLPSNLKEFAHINKDVVFVGVGNRIEIWSEENWNSYKGNDESFDDMANALSGFNV